MNKKKSYASGVNIGSSSILVTFVLLCLVTFAALSFVSANSDNKLAIKTAERTTNYYEANNTAELTLANINSLLKDHYRQTADKNEYFEGISDVMAGYDGLTNAAISVVETSKDEIQLKYFVPVTSNQTLNVTLSVIYPEGANQDMFEIKQWETVSQYVEEELPGDEKSGFLF